MRFSPRTMRKTPATFSSVGISSRTRPPTRPTEAPMTVKTTPKPRTKAKAGESVSRRAGGDARQVGDVGRHEGQDAGREEGDDAGREGEGDAERPRQVVGPALRDHGDMIATAGTRNRERGRGVVASEA